jgi:hypothetical protein
MEWKMGALLEAKDLRSLGRKALPPSAALTPKSRNNTDQLHHSHNNISGDADDLSGIILCLCYNPRAVSQHCHAMIAAQALNRKKDVNMHSIPTRASAVAT